MPIIQSKFIYEFFYSKYITCLLKDFITIYTTLFMKIENVAELSSYLAN